MSKKYHIALSVGTQVKVYGVIMQGELQIQASMDGECLFILIERK